MKKATFFIALLLGIALINTEDHSFIRHFSKPVPKKEANYEDEREIDRAEVRAFINYSGNKNANLLWVIKFITEDLYQLFVLSCLVWACYKIYFPLFLIAALHLFYKVCDIWFMIYDNKETAAMYWVILFILVASTIIILVTKHQKLKIVR